MKKTLIPETFLNKTFEELKDLLVLKETNSETEYNFPFPTFKAVLKNGQLNIFGIEKSDAVFTFFSNGCRLIRTIFSVDETKELTVVLNDFFPDKFDYLTIENYNNLENLKFYKSTKGELPKIANKEIFTGLSDNLDLDNITNYKFINAHVRGYSVIIKLIDGFEYEENAFTVDIFQMENGE